MQELHDVCLFHKKCSLRSYLLEIFFYKIYTGTKFYELCTKICTLYARKKEKLEMKKIKMNISSIGMWIVLVTIVGLVAFSGCTDKGESDTAKIGIEQKLVIAEPWGISSVDPAKAGGTLNKLGVELPFSGGVEPSVITKLLKESGLKNVSAEPMIEIGRLKRDNLPLCHKITASKHIQYCYTAVNPK